MKDKQKHFYMPLISLPLTSILFPLLKKSMKPSICIIPCKTDSKRVKLKNLQKIGTKTLLELTIDYAKNSNHIQDIFVSSESSEVINIASNYSLKHISRPSNLLGDAEVCDVYVDALLKLKQQSYPLDKYEYLVALQPDHPDRDTNVDELIEYAFDNKYDDLFTVSSECVRTGSIRILKIDHALKGHVSRRVGCFKDNATNIHSLADLNHAASRLQQ